MPELPTGTVTFLFTDIEGSTRLVQRLGDRWPQILAEHQRLLREAFAAHSGHEIDTQGDSFFYAFARAKNAVAAAVAGQRALSGQQWPEEGEIRVRMGVHTGEAAQADNRYLGLAVHRGARVASAAHGGQVLLSSTTRDLVVDEIPDGQELHDLGEYELKDLPRRERLYQLVAAGLRREFPPPKSGAPDPWDFSGREQELAEAARTVLAGQKRRYRLIIAAIAGIVVAGAAAAFVTMRGDSAIVVRPNSVAVIDPKTNAVIDQVPVGAMPGPLAIGDGFVWVGNLEDRTLSKINPAIPAVEANTDLDRLTPTDVVVGEGGVWVAHGVTGSVSKVRSDLVVGTIRVTSGSSLLATPDGAVAVGGGAVWVAYGDSTVAKIDPEKKEVVKQTFAGDAPTAIAFGAGSVWVVNRDGRSVSRFAPDLPTGLDEAAATVNVARQPRGIAIGGGAVWVAHPLDDAISRISIRSEDARLFPVGDGPVEVAFGADAVWVANSEDGTVSRLSRETGKLESTIEVGNRPSGVAVGEGRVWVTIQAR